MNDTDTIETIKTTILELAKEYDQDLDIDFVDALAEQISLDYIANDEYIDDDE